MCFGNLPALVPQFFWMGLLLMVFSSAAGEAAQRKPASFPGRQSDWHGFTRFDFSVGGNSAVVVAPKSSAAGRPWVWHGEFFGHKPAPDVALLGKGFHIVYLRVPNLLGSPIAVKHWNLFYKELTGKYGLAGKPALVGLSRGGLYCYNWATANPDKVACIYGDAPVCDFKSWPGGKGKGKGSPRDWKLVLKTYGFENEKQALSYSGNPVDSLKVLAQAKVPLLHVYGDADKVVPWEENTGLIADRYRKLGGTIRLIAKPGVGHHPHGLEDSTPIVDFIVAHASAPERGPQTRSGVVANRVRPNIVFLMTDDQRNDTLGCAGHAIVKTPNIDRLASGGVRFENMFVSHSICWVSRATILTGQFARSWGSPTRPDSIREGQADEIFPILLRRAGYRTGFFGKWHARVPRGFRQAEHFDCYEQIGRNPYFKKQPDGSLRHETQVIGDRAVDFIKTQPDDKPFALTLWFNASHAEDRDKRPGIGHFPWPKVTDGMYEDLRMPEPRLRDPAIFDAQPEFLQRSINRERFFWRWDTPEKYQTNMRAYFRMLSGIDHVLGRVVQQLQASKLAENTIIVYTADNGYYMGDRGFAGKWSHYEQSLRVPLVIYDPRLPAGKRGRVVTPLAINVDLPATFLDWAGVTIPDSYQGDSLRSIVNGTTPPTWRTDFFCEHLVLAPHITWEGVRSERYKYARYFDQKPVYEFLHDLQTDPDELKNLANSPIHQEILQGLRMRCDQLVTKYGGPLAPLEQRVPRRRGKTPQKKSQTKSQQ